MEIENGLPDYLVRAPEGTLEERAFWATAYASAMAVRGLGEEDAEKYATRALAMAREFLRRERAEPEWQNA